MKISVLLVSLFFVMVVGCQSKQSCLQKYHYNSCEDFNNSFSKVTDNDVALKMHSISIECGCKTNK